MVGPLRTRRLMSSVLFLFSVDRTMAKDLGHYRVGQLRPRQGRRRRGSGRGFVEWWEREIVPRRRQGVDLYLYNQIQFTNM